ncbi:hypothetical protein EDD18DRAFT_1353865 [Armillaria luteobubalina]|uniref:Uncharacterized protein n=1 Tax=Armillaria luteobubalina TaxID=153913 RepID=A0AA39Q516_9AGAR|nr:hypothetical protein EDD18DRAFT_1353865 [Armillaria luteobubalina]
MPTNQTIGRGLPHTVTVQSESLCVPERSKMNSPHIMTGDARAGDGSTGDVMPGAHKLEARELEMHVWSTSGDVVAGGDSAGDVPAGVHLETRELEI